MRLDLFEFDWIDIDSEWGAAHLLMQTFASYKYSFSFEPVQYHFIVCGPLCNFTNISLKNLI